MIHPATRVFGAFGFAPISLSLNLASPVSWTGLVYYIFSEQSSAPLVCSPTSEFLTRSPKGLPEWTQARDLRRSMYIGTPMSKIRQIADADSTDVYRRQAWSFVIGHPRSLRNETLDDESASGDVLIDSKRVWFKIHDIETSHEPCLVMYRILRDPVLASNIYTREYDSKRNTMSGV